MEYMSIGFPGATPVKAQIAQRSADYTCKGPFDPRRPAYVTFPLYGRLGESTTNAAM